MVFMNQNEDLNGKTQIIRVENLKKSFNNLEVLKDISFSVYE